MTVLLLLRARLELPVPYQRLLQERQAQLHRRHPPCVQRRCQGHGPGGPPAALEAQQRSSAQPLQRLRAVPSGPTSRRST